MQGLNLPVQETVGLSGKLCQSETLEADDNGAPVIT